MDASVGARTVPVVQKTAFNFVREGLLSYVIYGTCTYTTINTSFRLLPAIVDTRILRLF